VYYFISLERERENEKLRSKEKKRQRERNGERNGVNLVVHKYTCPVLIGKQ
jgi:hypothetical protein